MPRIIPSGKPYHGKWNRPPPVKDVGGPPTSGSMHLSTTMEVDLLAMVVTSLHEVVVVVVLQEVAVVNP